MDNRTSWGVLRLNSKLILSFHVKVAFDSRTLSKAATIGDVILFLTEITLRGLKIVKISHFTI